MIKKKYLLRIFIICLIVILLLILLLQNYKQYIYSSNVKDISNVDNPFTLEDPKLIKIADKDINNLLSPKYNENSYFKWIPLLIKYHNKVNPSYLEFKTYDIFYDEETYIFEKNLIKLMKKYNRILDFGCGTCKIWRNNLKFINNHKIHCIDLDKNILSYPKYLLKNYNIQITEENMFDLEMNYDCVLFSEVIMQLDNPELFIKYIINKNPNIVIIVNHTIFSTLVSKLLTPFKNGLMKYIPILKTSYGRALTYQQTIEIFTNSGCSLIKEKKIMNNKIIFVFKKI